MYVKAFQSVAAFSATCLLSGLEAHNQAAAHLCVCSLVCLSAKLEAMTT